MRILLADDEKILALWLARALGQGGIVVDVVNDGRRIVAALKATAYDALVIDLDRPRLGALDVLVTLRTLRRRVPVLVLTHGDPKPALAVADDVLAKPFAVEDLEARLAALVRQTSLLASA